MAENPRAEQEASTTPMMATTDARSQPVSKTSIRRPASSFHDLLYRFPPVLRDSLATLPSTVRDSLTRFPPAARDFLPSKNNPWSQILVAALSAVATALAIVYILLSSPPPSPDVVAISGSMQQRWLDMQTVSPPKAAVSVIILITSAASSRGRRDLMRTQFDRSRRLLESRMGKGAVESVLIRFLIGNGTGPEVAQEAEEFNDFLFLDVPDKDPKGDLRGAPSATTLKVMHGIAWAVENYNFEYLVRLGDDAYFRIDYFRELVARDGFPKKMLLLGYIRSHIRIDGIVLDYPSGMGFVLTFDICNWIAMSSKLGVLMDTYPEDAIIGRWLLGLKVNRMHYIEGFHDYQWGMCSEESILIHKLPARAWRRIDDRGLLNCTVEHPTKPS